MLDFSNLSDDQLLELLKAAMNEACQRGEATRMAAQDYVIDTQERIEIEARVAAKVAAQKAEAERQRIERETEAKLKAQANKSEQEKVARNWQCKKALVLALEQWGITEDFELNIWSRGSDRRVYLQGSGRYGWKVCFYVSGNSYHPPQSLEAENEQAYSDKNRLKADKAEDWEQLKGFFSRVAELWKGDLRISSSEVQSVKEANPKHYAAYRKVLGLQEKAFV